MTKTQENGSLIANSCRSQSTKQHDSTQRQKKSEDWQKEKESINTVMGWKSGGRGWGGHSTWLSPTPIHGQLLLLV
jgi:hypothetical protein